MYITIIDLQISDVTLEKKTCTVYKKDYVNIIRVDYSNLI